GGVLLQLSGAARPRGVSATSYVVSVATLLWIEQPEPRPHPREEGSSFAGELREGIRLVFQHPLLRSLVAMMTTDAFAQQLALPIFLIFFYRSLHLSPAEAGLVFAGFGVGSIAGSLYAARAVALLGLGRALAVGRGGAGPGPR